MSSWFDELGMCYCAQRLSDSLEKGEGCTVNPPCLMDIMEEEKMREMNVRGGGTSNGENGARRKYSGGG